jgi:Zn-dependent protease
MTILIFIVAFLITITIHEAAHAYVADKLGDPTARLMGRLTLNPIAHIDMYGTVLVPFFLILIGSPFVFGWAKPVPVDPYNLQNPKKDSAMISFAGPLVNIALATILALILRSFNPFLFEPVAEFLYALIRFNVVLAVFNLIPIHPLDGGKVLVGLLPTKEAAQFDLFLTRYGFILLLMLIFPIFGGTSLLSLIISPISSLILNLLLPGNIFI